VKALHLVNPMTRPKNIPSVNVFYIALEPVHQEPIQRVTWPQQPVCIQHANRMALHQIPHDH
jgi:hypothetical protein